MERDVERIAELYAAFGKRDGAAILMLMAEDVTIAQSEELPWGGFYSGHEGVQEFLTKLTDHVDARLEIERFIDAGQHVVALGRTVGKVKSNGIQFDVPVAHVWKLNEGRIVEFRPYIDNATMLAALQR